MLRASALGGILFGFWLLLSGHYTPLLLGLGVLSCVLVVYLCVRMDLVDGEVLALGPTLRFWLYFPWLMKEVFVSNVVVARVVLSRKMPIHPRMTTFHGTQETDLGKALYANSITLTPGTITTGIEGQEFQIHALIAIDLETGEENEMNRRCTAVERGR